MDKNWWNMQKRKTLMSDTGGFVDETLFFFFVATFLNL